MVRKTTTKQQVDTQNVSNEYGVENRHEDIILRPVCDVTCILKINHDGGWPMNNDFKSKYVEK